MLTVDVPSTVREFVKEQTSLGPRTDFSVRNWMCGVSACENRKKHVSHTESVRVGSSRISFLLQTIFFYSAKGSHRPTSSCNDDVEKQWPNIKTEKQWPNINCNNYDIQCSCSSCSCDLSLNLSWRISFLLQTRHMGLSLNSMNRYDPILTEKYGFLDFRKQLLFLTQLRLVKVKSTEL